MLEGNKRTGYVTCGTFLKRNGQNLHVSGKESTAAITGLANDTLTKEHFVQRLQDHCT